MDTDPFVKLTIRTHCYGMHPRFVDTVFERKPCIMDIS